MTWFSTLFYTLLIIRAAFCTAEMENEMFLYSTSVGSMSKLVQLENKLMSSLQVIAKDMQQKLNMIRLYQQLLKRSTEDSSVGQEEYVANPLNAFALLRRLQQDWPKWLTYLKTQPEIVEMQQQLQKAPNEKDLQTAIKGLLRIERIYDLEASHMAKGLLLGNQYDSFLTAPDCVALADNLFNRTEYSRSTHWYRTAIRLYKKPHGKLFGRVLGLKRKALNRKYAQAIVYEPDVSQEPQVSGVEPEWKDNVDNVIRQLVSQSSSDKIQYMVNKYLEVNEQIFIDQRAKHKAKPNAVEKGCRGLWPRRQTLPLTCRYVQQHSAYLRLAPLKMEILSLQPLIQLYHDVLHDSEIEAVKNVTNHRAMAENLASTVKLITLRDAPHTQNMHRRITDMSGLDVAQNNTLHLLNFGLGGYLGKQLKLQGNRIATVIFYASDVQLGGATIFPRLQLVVKPKRGSALLWYNLNAAGKPDPLTRHAVCPVVVGSRWAISKCIEDQQQLPKKLCLA